MKKEKIREVLNLEGIIFQDAHDACPLPEKVLRGKTQQRDFVDWRFVQMVVMYCDVTLNWSTTKVGEYFNRDYSTVLNAIKCVTGNPRIYENQLEEVRLYSRIRIAREQEKGQHPIIEILNELYRCTNLRDLNRLKKYASQILSPEMVKFINEKLTKDETPTPSGF
jgi:hypothetical protein